MPFTRLKTLAMEERVFVLPRLCLLLFKFEETGGILFREHCLGREKSLSSAPSSASSAKNSVSLLLHINQGWEELTEFSTESSARANKNSLGPVFETVRSESVFGPSPASPRLIIVLLNHRGILARLEEDKCATTDVQNGLVFFFLFKNGLNFKRSPRGKSVKKCEKV